MEYLAFDLPGGPDGISALTDDNRKQIREAVARHRGGKILIHCLEGRHRSAGVVFDVLQHCYGQAQREALFKVVPHL